MLKTAAKTQNASIPLSIYWDPPDSLSQFYVYFHFAEIEKLEGGQQREMTIDLNGERYLTESVKLDYLNVLTIAPNNPPITGERLHVTINAAEGNKLPPILNAIEAFVLIELPNKTTAIEDGNVSSLFYFPCKNYAQLPMIYIKEDTSTADTIRLLDWCWSRESFLNGTCSL